jgi:hypothetical protein
MLLIYGDEKNWTDSERKECIVESLRIKAELEARGQFLDAAPLHPASTAMTVRLRAGETLVTEGPFAETTEQLGGYYVLDLPDLDAAIAVASRLPPVTKGTIEIRPIFTPEGLPQGRPVSSRNPSATPYLLLCYHNEADLEALGPDRHRAALNEAMASCREMNAAGEFLSSSPLHPSSTATCVRVRNGQRLVTDGPFAETHEVLGGYYLIQTESREAAIRHAARQPGAWIGSMEVREVIDMAPLRNQV